jgi:hypothetical protein
MMEMEFKSAQTWRTFPLKPGLFFAWLILPFVTPNATLAESKGFIDENHKWTTWATRENEGLFADEKSVQKKITICWVDGDAAIVDGTSRSITQQKLKVQTYATNSWQRFTNIEFIWKNGTSGCDVLVKNHDQLEAAELEPKYRWAPHTLGHGVQTKNGTVENPGMELNLTQIHESGDSYRKEWLLRITSVHEFGHLLSLVHEHNRPPHEKMDALGVNHGLDEQGNVAEAPCAADPLNIQANGTKVIGDFDLNSIMLYGQGSMACVERTPTTFVPEPSCTDIASVRELYGYKEVPGYEHCVNACIQRMSGLAKTSAISGECSQVYADKYMQEFSARNSIDKGTTKNIAPELRILPGASPPLRDSTIMAYWTGGNLLAAHRGRFLMTYPHTTVNWRFEPKVKNGVEGYSIEISLNDLNSFPVNAGVAEARFIGVRPTYNFDQPVAKYWLGDIVNHSNMLGNFDGPNFYLGNPGANAIATGVRWFSKADLAPFQGLYVELRFAGEFWSNNITGGIMVSVPPLSPMINLAEYRRKELIANMPPLASFLYAPESIRIPGGRDPLNTTHFVNPLHVDETEVTRAHYAIIMHQFPFPITDGTPDGYGYNRPADGLTYFDAILYCNKRSEKEGKASVYKYGSASYDNNGRCINLSNLVFVKSANGYRLPTPNEWSYAYKAGVPFRYFWGMNILDNQGWLYAWLKIGSLMLWDTYFVASKQPNPWGLYDMAGNAHEYVWTETNDPYSSAMGGACNTSEGSHNATLVNLFKSQGEYRYGFRVVRNGASVVGPILAPLLLN